MVTSKYCLVCDLFPYKLEKKSSIDWRAGDLDVCREEVSCGKGGLEGVELTQLLFFISGDKLLPCHGDSDRF